jgi:hypothetical protein
MPEPRATWQAACMSSAACDIITPGRPEIREVSAGSYAYIQPDGN